MNRGKRESIDLRRRAEERLGRPPAPSANETEAQRLVHELRVHQIELELQNEELRASRLEVEAALERYTQLFDFAPRGYFVVAADGVIRSVNFAGARLLGMERGRLTGKRLRPFVAERDRGRLDDFLSRALAATAGTGPPAACELSLGRASPCGPSLALTVAASGPVFLTGLVQAVTAIRNASATRAIRMTFILHIARAVSAGDPPARWRGEPPAALSCRCHMSRACNALTWTRYACVTTAQARCYIVVDEAAGISLAAGGPDDA